MRQVASGLVDVVPERQRQLRGCRHHRRQPYHRNYCHQHLDDLGSCGTGIDSSIGLGAVRRNGATDGDQRCEPNQRLSSRIEDLIRPHRWGARTAEDLRYHSLVMERKAA